MKMLLKGTDYPADNLLTDLGVRELVLASVTGLMMMMMVMVQVMMVGRRFLLSLGIRQSSVMLLISRRVNVLLQRRVARLLDADLLDQRWRRRGGATCP